MSGCALTRGPGQYLQEKRVRRDLESRSKSVNWDGVGNWGNQVGFSHLKSCKPAGRELSGMLCRSSIILHTILPPFSITKPLSLTPTLSVAS